MSSSVTLNGLWLNLTWVPMALSHVGHVIHISHVDHICHIGHVGHISHVGHIAVMPLRQVIPPQACEVLKINRCIEFVVKLPGYIKQDFVVS